MEPDAGQRILVAGAGMAGLTAALAFARHGFSVRLFERSTRLEEVGAGLQLSPNATRILDRLGVLDRLLPSAVRPQEIAIRRADTMGLLATVPLGAFAERRWRAPYLTIHRADLQAALVAAVAAEPRLSLQLGRPVETTSTAHDHVRVDLGDDRAEGALLVGADGVWSGLRQRLDPAASSRYSGYLAWRAIAQNRAGVFPADRVTTFVSSRFHLVTYPIRAGEAVNLVAVMRAPPLSVGWTSAADPAPLWSAMAGAEPALLAAVRAAGSWTTWPIHEAPLARPWTDGRRTVLIGDAAHAVSPYAAQGAAMAIEDAMVLARCVADHGSDMAAALARYEALRRPRVSRVAARGTLNQFAWHAAGPVALVRNQMLKLRPPERLAADLDWLYGYDADEQP